MNETSNHDILEPKIWERENGERSLEYEVEKFQNLNKKSYKWMIKELEEVNSKLNVKIKKRNDEVIFDFSHTMMEIMNNILKQVAVKVKNHLDE